MIRPPNRINLPLHDDADVAELAGALIEHGLVMANPASGRIYGFDNEGDRLEFDPEAAFENLLEHCQGVQLWFDDTRDVYLSWGNQEEGGIEVFVDGLNSADIILVARALCESVVATSVLAGREVRICLDRV